MIYNQLLGTSDIFFAPKKEGLERNGFKKNQIRRSHLPLFGRDT
jgi:hypothetical protein